MNTEDIQARIDGAWQIAEAWDEAMDERLDSLGYGTKRVTDFEFMVWFEQKIGLRPLAEGQKMTTFPPEPLIMPDGRVIVASRWAMALAFVKDGPEMLARYERALNKLVGVA